MNRRSQLNRRNPIILQRNLRRNRNHLIVPNIVHSIVHLIVHFILHMIAHVMVLRKTNLNLK